LSGPFNILWVDIAPAEDDQIFLPPGDEERAILDEAQVARFRERAIRSEARVRNCFGFIGAPPVALCNARAREADLADPILAAREASLGIGDHHVQARGDLTARREPFTAARVSGLDALAATECIRVNGHRHRGPAPGTS